MSLYDPRIIESQKEATYQGNPLVALVALFLGGVMVLIGAAYGVFAMTIFDLTRSSELNPGPLDVPDILGVGMPIALVLALIVRALRNRATNAYGGTLGYALSRIPWLFLGAFVVSFAGRFVLTPISAVGATTSISGETSPWGTGQWVLYYLGVYIQAPFAVLLLIALIRFGVEMRTRLKAAHLFVHGHQTTGTVIQLKRTSIEVNDEPLVVIVVEFIDRNEQTRYVTKRRAIPEHLVPQVGQDILVVYNPLKPHDPKQIMLALGAQTYSGQEFWLRP